MKINESGRLTSINAYRNNATTARDLKTTSKSGTAKDDVKISEEAKELLEAQRAGQSERAERLAEIKSSVQAGTYHVDSNRIAEKLLPYLKQ